jgi:hypothetical protein
LRGILHRTRQPWHLSALIQHLIQREFGVCYSVQHISQLLRTLGCSDQKARFVAAKRDDVARADWRTQTWPRIVREARRRGALLRTAGYYRRNQGYMRYDHYLAQGWPIGTGVVEGACRHVVKDRMEQSGMRWTKNGAEAVLDLRAIRINGQWETYWAYHRQQQHKRLYADKGSVAPQWEFMLDSNPLIRAA